MQLHIVTVSYYLNINIKWKAQQKQLKTIRSSYTGLELSINAKKGT
jgi:hypothetical protein